MKIKRGKSPNDPVVFSEGTVSVKVYPTINRIYRRNESSGERELNLAMLFHAKGMDSKTLSYMIYPQSSLAEVFEDLMRRRNRRVIEEIFVQLREGDRPIVVPWGAAHMPQIAIEIQQANFKLSETRDHVAIPFGAGKQGLRNGSEHQR